MFSDTSELKETEKKCIDDVVKRGLFTGMTSDMFKPNDLLSQSQAQIIIKRLQLYLYYMQNQVQIRSEVNNKLSGGFSAKDDRKLYYFDYRGYMPRLCQYDFVSNHSQILYDNKSIPMQLSMSGERLIFFGWGSTHLESFHIKTSKVELLSEDIYDCFHVLNDSVYFMEDEALKTQNIETGKVSTIAENIPIQNNYFTIDGLYAYFFVEGCLYRCNLIGGIPVLVFDAQDKWIGARDYIVQDGIVYYISNGINQYNIGTSEKYKLKSESPFSIHVEDNCIFYQDTDTNICRFYFEQPMNDEILVKGADKGFVYIIELVENLIRKWVRWCK